MQNNGKDDFFTRLKGGQKTGGERGIRRIMRYGAMSDDMANPLAEKTGGCFFIATHHSEQHFELKTSEFRCEIKF